MAPVSNATASAVIDSAHDHQASGRAIFWALVALGLNARFQPSFYGRVWSGDTFQSSLQPHRSSPLICLEDATVDLWIIVNRFHHPPPSDKDSERSPAIGVVVRLAVFILGVLPQAIKLFCMRGVLPAQLIAAAFLVSTVASFARTLPLEDPDVELVSLQNQLEEKRPRPQFTLGFLGWALSVPLVYTAWSFMCHNLHISIPDNIANTISWISAITSLLCFVYLLQHFAFTIVLGKAYIRSVVPPLILMINPVGTVEHIFNARSTYTRSFVYGVTVNLAMYCYAIAYFLNRVVQWLLPDRKKQEVSTTSNTDSSENVHPTAHGVEENLSPSDSISAVQPSPDREGSPAQTCPECNSSNSEPQDKATLRSGSPSLAKQGSSTALPEATAEGAAEDRARSRHPQVSLPPSNPPSSNSVNNLAHDRPLPVIQFSNTVCGFILRQLSLIVRRIFTALTTSFGHALNRVEDHLTTNSTDTVWLAFALLHFTTLANYYLVFYDGAGTYSPSWTSLLG